MCNDLANGEKNHIFYLELVIPYSYSDYLTNVIKMGALYKNVRSSWPTRQAGVHFLKRDPKTNEQKVLSIYRAKVYRLSRLQLAIGISMFPGITTVKQKLQ